PGEGLVAPRVPVDGVVLVLLEVGAGLAREPVHDVRLRLRARTPGTVRPCPPRSGTSSRWLWLWPSAGCCGRRCLGRNGAGWTSCDARPAAARRLGPTSGARGAERGRPRSGPVSTFGRLAAGSITSTVPRRRLRSAAETRAEPARS